MSAIPASLPLNRASEVSNHVAQAAGTYAQLVARSNETVATRKLLPANVQMLKEAGLFRTIQPKRCGGHEFSLHAHIDVVEEIARGCGSTGWVTGVMHAHSWLMGLFPQKAQEDVYGPNPNALISAVIGPRGKARKTADGLILTGFWPFCSGVHHADWVILGEMVENEEGEIIDSGVVVLPASEIAIQDDWYVGGLAGTGSNSVVAKDVFVPAHRFLSIGASIEGEAPGMGLHQSNLYYSAAVPALALFIATPALGLARRTLEQFMEKLPGRVVSYTFNEKQLDMAVTHIEVAEAATKIDTARTLLHAMVDEVEHYAERHEVMPYLRRAKARMDVAFAVRLCHEAAQTLYIATGGSGLAEKSPIHLAQKDLQAVNMHGLLTMKTNLEMYGRALLGLPANSPVV